LRASVKVAGAPELTMDVLKIVKTLGIAAAMGTLKNALGFGRVPESDA